MLKLPSLKLKTTKLSRQVFFIRNKCNICYAYPKKAFCLSVVRPKLFSLMAILFSPLYPFALPSPPLLLNSCSIPDTFTTLPLSPSSTLESISAFNVCRLSTLPLGNDRFHLINSVKTPCNNKFSFIFSRDS